MPKLTTDRKLRKAPAKKRIAGVCAGFAYWLGMEVWAMRVLWLLFLLLSGGFIFLVYIIFWIVLEKWPETPEDFDTVTGD